MSQLPRVANAILGDRKITQFLLSTVRPTGASEAKFFMSFGFSPGNLAELKSALLNHPLNNPVTSQRSNRFGQKFEVSCSLAAPDGRNPCIISVWIIEPPDANPRFITAYPNP
jgi:filamentous hemagglutinin